MTETHDFVALRKILTEIIRKICKLTNCQSVSIRLENNGDARAKDSDGNYILDENGSPFLECVCEDVPKGKNDPKLPYFTEK